jgi:ATP-dependent Clp protease ATP-binding subunit ClpC
MESNGQRRSSRRFFRPEFLNRVDDSIVFHPLTRADLVQIIDYETGKLAKRLKAQNLDLTLDQSARDFLIEKGYNPDYGARPLRRALGQYIEDALSEMLLSGELHGKHHVTVKHREGEEALFFDASAAVPEDTTNPPPVGAGAQST